MTTFDDRGPNGQGLQLAAHGVGPLFQRDYWAVLGACRLDPASLMEEVGRRFCEFGPPDLVTFAHSGGADANRLDEGDELEVKIRLAGSCRVRVVAREPQSFTLTTLPGHPEAGKITFGSYRNPEGAVLFHIRSRARSSSTATLLGFFTAGEAMQTNTWTDFIKTVANTFGDGVLGAVHADTSRSEDTEDEGSPCAPTFMARGG